MDKIKIHATNLKTVLIMLSLYNSSIVHDSLNIITCIDIKSDAFTLMDNSLTLCSDVFKLTIVHVSFVVF